MRTYKALFGELTSFENLYLAAQNAQKGKRFRADVAKFHNHLERSFIYDSYANRVGKGTHRAIERYHQFARTHDYVLKCDIRKFFPSIDHGILKETLRRRIACPDTLWLIDLIIDHSNPQEPVDDYFPGDDFVSSHVERKGLPIGNLTSQFWGNVFMDSFDHYIKDSLGYKGYVRYVDDFVIFAQEKQTLHTLKTAIEKYLATLRLKIHPHKTQIYKVTDGVPFLGFRVFPTFRYVLKPKVKRYKRHIRKTVVMLRKGRLSPQDLENKLNSWLGHIRFGKNYFSEQQVYFYIRDQGVNLLKHPSGSWRVLEQQR